jgi:hypothetical protein
MKNRPGGGAKLELDEATQGKIVILRASDEDARRTSISTVSPTKRLALAFRAEILILFS